MLIFAAQATPRLVYILDHLLVHSLGLTYKLTDNPDYFRKSPSLKINYGTSIVEGCLNIPASTLLFEEKIVEQILLVQKSETWQYTFFAEEFEEIPDFKVHTTHLHFDLLAASFYLLSRYEEYLPSIKDVHNRFKPQGSLAYKNGFLGIPLIDFWVQKFSEKLKLQYPELTFKEHSFHQINTIDIDFAYKYKGHNWFAKSRKLLGSIAKFKPDFNSILPPVKDPYDTYDFLIKEAAAKNIETLFFLLLADYGGHDKNISPSSPEMKSLAARLSESFKCGIHPSYKAALNSVCYKQEHTYFKELTQEAPTISRHHFLKIRVPETYEQLDQFGIEKDFTMAYSTEVGFRASTSRPFYLFDLHSNCTLKTLVYSPCVMDVILKNSLGLTPEQSIQKIQELKEEVKKAKGIFISIWHNSNFDPSQGWNNWEQVYKSLFE
ncbi:MAG: hypothetical protein CFE21_16980 [Bacteroidetes bacterium B1(2017)]|nr:MAG: hypothetical protein CFE21_16980 [Bacteroidetes bacterium B1(2017)]